MRVRRQAYYDDIKDKAKVGKVPAVQRPYHVERRNGHQEVSRWEPLSGCFFGWPRASYSMMQSCANVTHYADDGNMRKLWPKSVEIIITDNIDLDKVEAQSDEIKLEEIGGNDSCWITERRNNANQVEPEVERRRL